MSTLAPELPLEPRESFADDVVGMGSFFIDPEGASKRATRKWFWIAPLIVVSIIGMVAQYMRIPIMQTVMENMTPPNGLSQEQWDKQVPISMMIQHVVVWFVPVIAAIMMAFQSVIMLVMCMLSGVNAKFRTLFNIVAGCALITALEQIASIVVLKLKGSVDSLAELKPALGLDIFMPDGANKFLVGFLSYFTVFNIWWIIMIVLVTAATFKIAKSKAFVIILPTILIFLVFIMLGAAFTPGKS